jgi:hypothetical protein
MVIACLRALRRLRQERALPAREATAAR